LLAYQGFVTIVCSYADFVDLQKLNLGSPSWKQRDGKQF
jgi:hypothetical protein